MGNPLKVVAAAIQMASEPSRVSENLERADGLLKRAHESGADLAVLPEMFNTGYGLIPDYSPSAESIDGRTLNFLRERGLRWNLSIAAGFVERLGNHLYDSLAFFEPGGDVHVYRKRNLVFWERFRFLPGRSELVVPTKWGRVGFAVCADMIYRKVWDGYRDRIDLAIISSAWPDFTCRDSGRKHWLFGHVGAMAATIPGKVAADLGVPVVFSNQCGPTKTTIPLLGLKISEKIADQFAGGSRVCDGLHGSAAEAGRGEGIALAAVTIHPPKGPISCHFMSPSAAAASSSASARS